MKRKIAAAYVRVSTQEQAKDGYSVGEQIERLKKYCDAMQWTLYKVYSDAGYSGAGTDRPALQDLINDVKSNKVDIVVVYKLDRLSRSQLDTLYLIEKVFLKNGSDFVSMNENFDTSTPFGRAMIGILAVFAQLEREQIKERMQMGADARAKDGKWRGGICPYGYDYKDGQLIVNEYEAMIIRQIYAEFLAGKPMFQIEHELKEKGYTQRGNPFTPCNIRYILTNKVYCGQIRFRNQFLPGNHEPIIDEQTIDAATRIIDANRQRRAEYGYTTSKTNTTYLGGLLICGVCGGKYGKRLVGSGQNRHATYVCYSRHKKVRSMVKDPACMNKIYRCDDLDDLIFNEIRKLAFDPSYIHTVARSDEKEKIRVIDAEIKNVDKQISRFMDLYGFGRFTAEQLDAKLVPLEDKRNRLKDELRAIQEDKTRISESEAITAINSFSDILDNGDFNEIRSVIETLIEYIVIDGDDITIHWRFS